MDSQYTKSKVLSSLFWKLMERGGTQGIQLIVTVILARLLLPGDFGLIAIVGIFITLSTVFVQSGFNTALVQKKEADDVDFSSIFFLSLVISALLYIILFFVAPHIAVFYEIPQLVPVLRVLSLTLFLGAFNSIQNAYIARNMLFKKLFLSSLGAVMISGVIGIGMAYTGFGVWALVWQQLISQLSISIILWFTAEWRPKILFSFTRVTALFSFGWRLLVATLIDTLYNDLRSLIIGKMYTPATLGFYNRGQQFPQIIVSNLNGSIQSVMLPALALHQDDQLRVKKMMRRAIVTSSFIIFPMMMGLAVTSEALVVLLLTDKWLPAVPYLQIFCASYALWPIHTANLQAINALGYSDIFLKLEVIKKVIGITVLGISIPFGVYALALGVLVVGIISTFINAYPNLKLLNYSYQEQWKDIFPSFLNSLVMGAVILPLSFLQLAAWIILPLQIIVGFIVYIGLAQLFKIESFRYLLTTIQEYANSRKGKSI